MFAGLKVNARLVSTTPTLAFIGPDGAGCVGVAVGGACVGGAEVAEAVALADAEAEAEAAADGDVTGVVDAAADALAGADGERDAALDTAGSAVFVESSSPPQDARAAASVRVAMPAAAIRKRKEEVMQRYCNGRESPATSEGRSRPGLSTEQSGRVA